MSNLKNYSRRRFLAKSGLGLVAFAGMPGFLQAMEGMQGLHGPILNRMSNSICFANRDLCQFYRANKRRCNNTRHC
jgi:hypothetical protein